MRLASYLGSDGEAHAAVVVDRGGDALIDLQTASRGRLTADLGDLLAAGEAAMDLARSIALHDHPTLRIADVELLAPLARPGKLVAVAGNFQAHITEGGGEPLDKARTVPKLFLKPSSSIVGPAAALVLPTISDQVDWELELAIVIGRAGRDIPVERARSHIAGYAVINDISARSVTYGAPDRTIDQWDGFFDWLHGKWADGFAPWGPWITTVDEISPDPNDLEMTLRVNDRIWQHGTTADMIFSPEEVISFGSQFMTWEPGDVIAGGTLDGTGIAAGVFLRAGDTMTATIAGLGSLTTPVLAPGRDPDDTASA